MEAAMQLEHRGTPPAGLALTAEDIRGRLAASGRVLDDPGARAGRIHAFEVAVAGTISEEERRRGAGLDIAYGFHPSPFGGALILMTGGAICGLAFVDEDAVEERRAVLDDMAGRWPLARFHSAPDDTAPLAARVFGGPQSAPREPVPVVLIGTSFDLDVWRTLLRIPMGHLVSYTAIARHLGQPAGARAVGTANGRNPISFVVPCHRALRSDGTLGGYYWGLQRKRAMIGWEAVQMPRPSEFPAVCSDIGSEA
jgi:AraC family transcriptional regulator of adaptative response/methylated-DNA-[protein]-cysteine methyltransferase